MRYITIALAIFTLAACGQEEPTITAGGKTLAEARSSFKTNLTKQHSAHEAVEAPPTNLFLRVAYPAPLGNNAAYISPDPRDNKKHSAIIWITGGDCNTIGDVWSPAPSSNDQTAAAFRNRGVVMMFPSLRGGNKNPGSREGFFGEVEDVLAARDYLAKMPYVDPNRIYLGGHSTGGTLAMLAGESSSKFRAVFAFGPVENPAGYGDEYGPPVNFRDANEIAIRSPGRWLTSVESPMFVIEGESQGNIDALRAMKSKSTNAKISFVEVRGRDHFSVLSPVNNLLAQKVSADTGPKCNITLTSDEASAAR